MSERELAPVAGSDANQEIAEWLAFVRQAMHWRQIDLAIKLGQVIGVPFTDSAIAWWEKGKRAIPGVVVGAVIRATGAPTPWQHRDVWQEWETFQQWRWVKAQVESQKKRKRRKSAS